MPSLGGWPDVPCAECGAHVSGIAWGDRCPACTQKRKARAAKLARRVALGATVLMGLYVWWRDFPPGLARVYSIIAIPVTFILVYRIAQHLAMAWLSTKQTHPENTDATSS
ncbi:MAG: hypothetical protein ACREL6_06145 [Gemmatimonadales bacterium]